jgi:adenylate cyclase
MLTMQADARRRVALLLLILGGAVVIGAVFGATTGSGFRDAPVAGAMLGALAGVINGVTMAGVIVGAELFLLPTRLGHVLERQPFLLTFAIKVLVYGAVIVLVVAGGLGWRIVAVAPIALSADLATAIAEHLTAPAAPRVARGLVPVGLAIFMLQMSRLVGERTLRNIVLGRYHRPRSEERFFLFVDIAGSTPLAERIGPDAVHRFLGEVFRLASDPIDDHRGDVYQYVGDEIVITWLVAEGREGARPIACFFAIEQALSRAAPAFERTFGAVPRIRGALHAGPVIAGEVGGSRRAIVYHGDVMNTASRIEQATRDLDRPFLVSADALERLADLEGFAPEDLGLHRLRGRAAAIQVYAVAARPPGPQTRC